VIVAVAFALTGCLGGDAEPSLTRCVDAWNAEDNGWRQRDIVVYVMSRGGSRPYERATATVRISRSSKTCIVAFFTRSKWGAHIAPWRDDRFAFERATRRGGPLRRDRHGRDVRPPANATIYGHAQLVVVERRWHVPSGSGSSPPSRSRWRAAQAAEAHDGDRDHGGASASRTGTTSVTASAGALLRRLM
jgi:hypothetical protein